MESATDSLRLRQYTYCVLPIMAPEFMRSNKPQVFYYQPGDDQSSAGAQHAPRRFARVLVPRKPVRKWDYVASAFADQALFEPGNEV